MRKSRFVVTCPVLTWPEDGYQVCLADRCPPSLNQSRAVVGAVPDPALPSAAQHHSVPAAGLSPACSVLSSILGEARDPSRDTCSPVLLLTPRCFRAQPCTAEARRCGVCACVPVCFRIKLWCALLNYDNEALKNQTRGAGLLALQKC